MGIAAAISSWLSSRSIPALVADGKTEADPAAEALAPAEGEAAILVGEAVVATLIGFDGAESIVESFAELPARSTAFSGSVAQRFERINFVLHF